MHSMMYFLFIMPLKCENWGKYFSFNSLYMTHVFVSCMLTKDCDVCPDGSLFAFVIVSLDNKQWQFTAQSAEVCCCSKVYPVNCSYICQYFTVITVLPAVHISVYNMKLMLFVFDSATF